VWPSAVLIRSFRDMKIAVRAMVAASIVAVLVVPAREVQAAPLAAPVRAAATNSPCTEWKFTQPTLSTYHAVTIAHTTAAYVLGPRHPVDAKHAGIVLLHGANGNACSLWWAARLLAGRDYVTVVVGYKNNTLSSSDHAGRSALHWLRTSTHNPWHGHIATEDLAIIGHSLGAHAAADLQQTEHVRTIVALDNLRAYLKADRSSGTTCHDEGPTERIKPVVPALSVGSEQDCYDTDAFDHTANKLSGFLAWLTKSVPVLQATLANSTHRQFTGTADFTKAHQIQLVRTSNYMIMWLNIWLRRHRDVYPRLIAATVAGAPVTAILSGAAGFGSAAYLPADGTWKGKECWDLRKQQCGPTA
jgi:hypothetical protein